MCISDQTRPSFIEQLIDQKRLPALLIGLLLFILALTTSRIAAAQQEAPQPPTTEATSGATASTGPLALPDSVPALPAVFSKKAPSSTEDLRVMQTHLKASVSQWEQATVSLTLNSRGGGAQGSGVIVTHDGLILTAAHVCGRPGRSMSVTTSDGKSYEAITLGRNSTQDAALVKIVSDREDWPALPVARTPAQSGEWCATLGHPGGHQPERGLVLRLGRVIFQNRWLIQSDCELIGGDSGGPLLNMRGEVIGINTRIGESTEFNLHVPSAVFLRDWDKFAKSEDFRTHSGAYLGLVAEVNTSGQGLIVTTVVPGAAADREGLKVGDLILEFDTETVTSVAHLNELVGRVFPGQSTSMKILRGGESLVLQPRLGMRWND